MTATATVLPFPSIDNAALADVNGGFDVGRMVDNGNRYGGAGAALGGGVGAVVGGVAGAAAGGVGALPGAATGAGVGGAIGGAAGWIGGAAADAWNQLRGR
ncbi:MAG: hypothetical protein JNL83_30805 [Myxococcales bacterium]|nr:hypothetical protein [Myxococcales bacterium]